MTEVLGILARSTKSGALVLEAGPASGVLHVVEGRCVAAESNEQRGPVEHAPALLVRVVDVCFGVARQDGGSFRFVADETPEWTCSEPVDLEVALDEVDRLLDEWRDIQVVIPSLEARVRLNEELEVEVLPVARDRWRLLTMIDGRRTVRDLVHRTMRPVLDVCHELMTLVDAGAVTIVEPPSSASKNSASNKQKKAADPPPPPPAVVQPEAPYGPGVETEHPGPVATDHPVPVATDNPGRVATDNPGRVATDHAGPDAATEEQAPADKGEFLRVFSALRDG